jgi:hypothetical protein
MKIPSISPNSLLPQSRLQMIVGGGAVAQAGIGSPGDMLKKMSPQDLKELILKQKLICPCTGEVGVCPKLEKLLNFLIEAFNQGNADKVDRIISHLTDKLAQAMPNPDQQIVLKESPESKSLPQKPMPIAEIPNPDLKQVTVKSSVTATLEGMMEAINTNVTKILTSSVPVLSLAGGASVLAAAAQVQITQPTSPLPSPAQVSAKPQPLSHPLPPAVTSVLQSLKAMFPVISTFEGMAKVTPQNLPKVVQSIIASVSVTQPQAMPDVVTRLMTSIVQNSPQLSAPVAKAIITAILMPSPEVPIITLSSPHVAQDTATPSQPALSSRLSFTAETLPGLSTQAVHSFKAAPTQNVALPQVITAIITALVHAQPQPQSQPQFQPKVNVPISTPSSSSPTVLANPTIKSAPSSELPLIVTPSSTSTPIASPVSSTPTQNTHHSHPSHELVQVLSTIIQTVAESRPQQVEQAILTSVTQVAIHTPSQLPPLLPVLLSTVLHPSQVPSPEHALMPVQKADPTPIKASVPATVIAASDNSPSPQVMGAKSQVSPSVSPIRPADLASTISTSASTTVTESRSTTANPTAAQNNTQAPVVLTSHAAQVVTQVFSQIALHAPVQLAQSIQAVFSPMVSIPLAQTAKPIMSPSTSSTVSQPLPSAFQSVSHQMGQLLLATPTQSQPSIAQSLAIISSSISPSLAKPLMALLLSLPPAQGAALAHQLAQLHPLAMTAIITLLVSLPQSKQMMLVQLILTLTVAQLHQLGDVLTKMDAPTQAKFIQVLESLPQQLKPILIQLLSTLPPSQLDATLTQLLSLPPHEVEAFLASVLASEDSADKAKKRKKLEDHQKLVQQLANLDTKISRFEQMGQDALAAWALSIKLRLSSNTKNLA